MLLRRHEAQLPVASIGRQSPVCGFARHGASTDSLLQVQCMKDRLMSKDTMKQAHDVDFTQSCCIACRNISSELMTSDSFHATQGNQVK